MIYGQNDRVQLTHIELLQVQVVCSVLVIGVDSVVVPSAAVGMLRGVKVKKECTGHVAQDDRLDGLGHLVSPVAAVVDVQGDDSQGAGERHQADGHSVVQRYNRQEWYIYNSTLRV